MSDSTVKLDHSRRTGLVAAMCVAVLVMIALASSLHLERNRSGFDFVTASSHMTWGAGGYTVAIAALGILFAALAAPSGEGDE